MGVGEGVGDGCLDYIWGYFAIIFSPTLGNFTLNPVLGSGYFKPGEVMHLTTGI